MVDVQIPTHCACGCKTPINENLIWAQRMRAAGVPEHVIKRNAGDVELVRYVPDHDRQEANRLAALRVARELRMQESQERAARYKATQPKYFAAGDRGRGRDRVDDLAVPSPQKIVQGKRVRLCVYCSIDAHYRKIDGCPCWCHR